MKTKELRVKTKEELTEFLLDSRKNLDDERFLAHEGKAKNVKRVRMIRKDIARALTLLQENRK